jgi:uncharacterized protein
MAEFMEYVAFEIGRGGPRGERFSANALLAGWNAGLAASGTRVTMRPGRGATGNYVLTCREPLSITELLRTLDGLPHTRGFALFSATEFTRWLSELERYLLSRGRPDVSSMRRPTPGVVMNRDPGGGMPPVLPDPDPTRDPVEDVRAWLSTTFTAPRVRGVWKNDLLRPDLRTLDPTRREGTWGALAKAMERAHGGRWTARAISTLRGLAKALPVDLSESPSHDGGRVARLLKEKRETILKVAAKHGARNVRVFGSFARGDATDRSDLDLLVDVGTERSPFFPGGLIAELESNLGLKVDVVTEPALHWFIRNRVLEEAVPL